MNWGRYTSSFYDWNSSESVTGATIDTVSVSVGSERYWTNVENRVLWVDHQCSLSYEERKHLYQLLTHFEWHLFHTITCCQHTINCSLSLSCTSHVTFLFWFNSAGEAAEGGKELRQQAGEIMACEYVACFPSVWSECALYYLSYFHSYSSSVSVLSVYMWSIYYAIKHFPTLTHLTQQTTLLLQTWKQTTTK